MRAQLVLLGAGGHGRVILDAVRASGEFNPVGFLDAKAAGEVDGVPILGGDDLLPRLRARGVTHAVVAVGSVRPGSLRAQLFDAVSAAGLVPAIVVHPSAVVSHSAAVGAGTVLLPRAVVNSRTAVGRNVIINTAAIIEHDCVVGDHAHISPGAVLGGGVRVGREAHVGIGAIVLESRTIGDRALVGAGAVVVESVPADTTVTGIPARPGTR